MTTGEMLDALAKIGRPTLMRMESGLWFARVDFPAPEGVIMQVKSDFDHPTHESALIQLIARLGGVVAVGSSISKSITVKS